MVNENQLKPFTTSNQSMFLRCKSFANTATQSNSIPKNFIPPPRIKNDSDKTDDMEKSQENTKKSKGRRSSGRKRKNQTGSVENKQSDEDFEPKEKKKTPRKRSKPPLKLKYHKISDFYSNTTGIKHQTEDTLRERVPLKSVPALPEVIELSSSEENEVVQEPNKHASDTHDLQRQKKKKPQTACPEYKVNEGTNFAVDAFRFGEIEGVTTNKHADDHDFQRQKTKKPQTACPEYKVIEGTNFAVDAFRFGDIEGVTTNKHADDHDLQRQKKKKPQTACPEYKVIEGTNFAVDAFRFGDIEGVTKYFLTHFHADHYVGLTKNFNMPLYVSRITGRLVQSILKVNPMHIRTLDINTTYVIDDVEVIAIDANHCPGAVMFIFNLQNGRTILHTGDFRASPEMESNPVFWNHKFYSIYLDTTYLHKSYDFDSQSDTLYRVEEEVRKFKEKNIGQKFLIVVGSYVIGKERVWCHIAQSFQMKVWLEPERRKAMNLIYSEENENRRITDCFCDVPEEAQLHVLPLQCINYLYLEEYIKDFEDHNVLAFKPTGWERNSKPRYGNRISIVGVQYSEHSSYRELERFVRFVQPEKVISTVPKSSSDHSITQKIPNKWLMNSSKPMNLSCQRSITSFMKQQKNAPSILSASRPSTSTKPNQLSSNNVLSDKEVGENSESDCDTDYLP